MSPLLMFIVGLGIAMIIVLVLLIIAGFFIALAELISLEDYGAATCLGLLGLAVIGWAVYCFA